MNPDRLKWCRAYLTGIHPYHTGCMLERAYEVRFKVGRVGGEVSAPTVSDAIQGAIGAIDALLPEE